MVTKRLYTWFLLKSYSDFPGKLLPHSLDWKSHHRKHTLHNANYVCFGQCEANIVFGKWRNSFSSHMFDTSSKRTLCKLQNYFSMFRFDMRTIAHFCHPTYNQNQILHQQKTLSGSNKLLNWKIYKSVSHSILLFHFPIKSNVIIPTAKGSIPSLELTEPLKINGSKMNFLLGWPIFRGYVCFREGNPQPLTQTQPVWCLKSHVDGQQKNFQTPKAPPPWGHAPPSHGEKNWQSWNLHATSISWNVAISVFLCLFDCLFCFCCWRFFYVCMKGRR